MYRLLKIINYNSLIITKVSSIRNIHRKKCAQRSMLYGFVKSSSFSLQLSELFASSYFLIFRGKIYFRTSFRNNGETFLKVNLYTVEADNWELGYRVRDVGWQTLWNDTSAAASIFILLSPFRDAIFSLREIVN